MGLDGVADILVFHGLFFRHISRQIRGLSRANLLLRDELLVNEFRIEIQIELSFFHDFLHERSENFLQVINSLFTTIVRNDHLGHDRLSLNKAANVFDHLHFVFDGRLKQAEQQIFFAGRKGSSVKGDEHRVQKVLHFVHVDQIDELGHVARLGLKHVEELLVRLNLLLVAAKVGHLDVVLVLFLAALGRLLLLFRVQLTAVADEQSDALVELGQIALESVVLSNLHGQLLLELLNLLHPVDLVRLGSVLQNALNLRHRQVALLLGFLFQAASLGLELNLVFAFAHRNQVAQLDARLQQQ